MAEPLKELASTGLLGLLLVIALSAVFYLFRKYSEEKDARIKDGQEALKLLMQVQSQVIDAVHKLGQIVEYAEKRYDDTRPRGGRS